jgi:hypothetical protein
VRRQDYLFDTKVTFFSPLLFIVAWNLEQNNILTLISDRLCYTTHFTVELESYRLAPADQHRQHGIFTFSLDQVPAPQNTVSAENSTMAFPFHVTDQFKMGPQD